MGIPAKPELVDQLRDLFIDRLSLRTDPAEFKEDTSLFEDGIGLDSVDALDIAAALESEYGVTVEDEDIDNFGNLGVIADFVIERSKS